MNALLPLHFESADVRMVMRDGEPWWVGLDATTLLGITRGRQALAALDDYERGAYIIGTLGGPQETTIINESGIYSLILRSRKPIAKKFKRWLTTEVLPSIRKFGVYPPPPLADLIENDRFDGRESTVADRFREERLLWEERHGKVFADSAPVFTRRIVDAIERGEGRIKTLDRVSVLIHAEIDVLYILTGRRAFSSQERRFIYRTRQHLLG